MLNVLILVGRLTKEPVIGKITNKEETPTSTFDIAVNDSYKKADGSSDTLFMTIKCIGPLADVCNKYLKKGSMISVTGRLHSFKYTSKKDNAQRNGYELIAKEVEFISTGDKPDQKEAKENNSAKDKK